MVKRLTGIVAAAGLAGALSLFLGGCKNAADWAEYDRERGSSGGMSMNSLLAAAGTANAVNAAGRGDIRAAGAWSGVAEYGRAEVAREAAREGRSSVVVNVRGNEGDRSDERNGVMTLQLGDQVYRGEVLNGRPHGTGKLQYPDGGWYEGEFRDGKRHGRGKDFCVDGRIIEAVFVNDNIEGLIVLTNRDGSISRGYLHKGKFAGKNEEDYKRVLEAERESDR